MIYYFCVVVIMLTMKLKNSDLEQVYRFPLNSMKYALIIATMTLPFWEVHIALVWCFDYSNYKQMEKSILSKV